MKKPMKFSKDAVKQVAGAQLVTTAGGLAAWDPDNKKEIIGKSVAGGRTNPQTDFGSVVKPGTTGS